MRIKLRQGETLTAVLADAAATTNPNAHVESVKDGQDTTGHVSLSGATAVTLLSAPDSSGNTLTGLVICNVDTAAVVLTIAHVVGSTSNTILTVTLAVGSTLIVDGQGVITLDSSGQVSTAASSAFTGTVTTTDGVSQGTARRVGGGAFRQVAASSAITGTTETQTNFSQSYTLPADTLKVGTRVRIRAQGIHTATTDAETHDILLVLGATTLATFATVDPANSDVFYFDFEFICRTAGASGTMVGCGVGGAVTPTTGTAKVLILASTTVDTTGALVIAVAIDRQATATDSDSCRLDYLAVDVIG